MNPGPRLARLATAAFAAGVLVGPALVLAPAGAAPSPHGSCADVVADAPGSPDGEYDITSYGRTLSVWCAGMAGTPVEYLTLQRGGPGVNISTANINYAPYVETSYARVRLNLPTSAATPFTVTAGDSTFSTTTGGTGAVPYGQGGSCGYWPGPFNIDLRGTPFAVDPADVVTTVGDGHGDVFSSDGGKVVWSPNARGNCGTLAIPAPFELIWTEAVLPVVTSPSDASVTSGDDAVFTASSTGGPGTDVVWQTSPDGATWTAVPGATGDTLTLTDVTRSMDGLMVRATYSNVEGTTTSSAATLAVAAVAPVVGAPADATVVSGADAVFSVTVTGDPAPSLQWKLSEDAGTTWADVPGATDAQLTLDDVTTAQDGLLVRLTAQNEQGTTTSASAELTVQALAPTVSAPADVTVVAGSDAAVSVTVTGDPAPTVRWELSPDGTTWVDSGLEGETTVLTEVPYLVDGWLFRAVAESTAGTAVSSPATLTVTAAAPVVLSAPEAVTVDAGEDAVFAVEATGDPEPDVQWQLSTDGQEWTDVAGATGWNLVLQDVSADEHGLLVRAVLANEGGAVATDGVALTVVSPPAASPVTAVPVAAARAVVGALPRTGTEPVGLAVVGGLMVLGGGLITVAARRRATAR